MNIRRSSALAMILLAGCANPHHKGAEVWEAGSPGGSSRSAEVRAQRAASPLTGDRAREGAHSSHHRSDAHHDVVLMAMAMLDRHYTYGGKRLHTGFDCSGFVSFVYREAAQRRLEGSSQDQARQSQPLMADQARPGDLVFFNTTGAAYSHVGIYVGDGRFVHAENERTGIKSSRLDRGYWSHRLEGFRRAIQ